MSPAATTRMVDGAVVEVLPVFGVAELVGRYVVVAGAVEDMEVLTGFGAFDVVVAATDALLAQPARVTKTMADRMARRTEP
jgi:hypothetical protein